MLFLVFWNKKPVTGFAVTWNTCQLGVTNDYVFKKHEEGMQAEWCAGVHIAKVNISASSREPA